MTNSSIAMVLERGLWWNCDDDVTGPTWFDACLEWNLAKHEAAMPHNQSWHHGSELWSWDSKRGWLCDCIDSEDQ